MKKLIAPTASLLLLACTSTSQGQHRAQQEDLRSRMARCSGRSRVITPSRPGQGPTGSGVEVAGPEGSLETVDIDDCPADVAPGDGGPGPNAGAGAGAGK